MNDAPDRKEPRWMLWLIVGGPVVALIIGWLLTR